MAVTAAEPRYSARELVREIQRRGGRVFRLSQVAVFVLTTDAGVAEWLRDLGGKPYTPAGFTTGLDGGYMRAKGIREWDIYVHQIPVRGEETVWEAAKRNRRAQLEVIE